MSVDDFAIGFILFIGVALFFVFGCKVISLIWEEVSKQRVNRLQLWLKVAKKLKFSCISEGTIIINRLSYFKLLQFGYSRSFKSCVLGNKDGVEIALGDLICKTRERGVEGDIVQTICILTFKNATFSHCFMRNEHKFYDYFNKLTGLQDINFDEDKKFSDAFIVQGTFVKHVKKIFSSEVRKLFLDNIAPELQFEAQSKSIIINYGDHLAPKNVDKFISFIFGLAEAINKQNS